MRILKDMFLGLVSGVLVILLIGNLVPGVQDIYREFFENAKSDVEELTGRKTDPAEGTDFTKLFAQGKKITDNSFQPADSGITGTGETFEASLNPFYEMLDDNEKKLYAQLYANAQNAESSFVPTVPVNKAQLEEVFEAVFYDHPELFWLDTGYSYQYTGDGTIVEADLKYNETADDLNASKTAFNNAVSEIVNGAQQYGDTESRERYVHDVLINTVSYDLNASLNQSAYSALVNHATVCAGYAKAFQCVMLQLGIPAYYVTGTSENEDHAWNIVLIDGRYTNVDVTWDDTSGERYRFFNKSDAEISDSHTRTGLSVKLPVCN